MIDEEMTMKMFGYDSSKLSRGSHKRIIVICPRCKNIRALAYRDYINLKNDDWCANCIKYQNPIVALNDPDYQYKLLQTFINEERTKKEFGYYSIDLSIKSHRKVYAVCSKCGKERLITHKTYMDGNGSCHACAMSGIPQKLKDDPNYLILLKQTGINEFRTFKDFGYYSLDLSYGCDKKVWSVCKVCGEEKIKRFRLHNNHSGMCQKCSAINREKLKRGPFNIEYFYSVWNSIKNSNIDELKTFKDFGYYSLDLTCMSSLKIYNNCSICNYKRLLEYRIYSSYGGKCINCRYKHTVSFQTRKKLSATRQGISINDWKEFTSARNYPIEFNNTLRIQVRKNANNQCEICNKKEIGRELSVHHIDRNKNNNKMENLIAVCMSCHGKIHNAITTSHLQYIKSLGNYEWN